MVRYKFLYCIVSYHIVSIVCSLKFLIVCFCVFRFLFYLGLRIRLFFCVSVVLPDLNKLIYWLRLQLFVRSYSRT